MSLFYFFLMKQNFYSCGSIDMYSVYEIIKQNRTNGNWGINCVKCGMILHIGWGSKYPG